MKLNRQTSVALFVMLAVFSVLPGCGKKNDGGPAGPAVAVAPAIGQVSGGCATINPNTSNTITFAGTLYNNQGSSLVGQFSAYGIGTYTGGFASSFWRTNYLGDRIDLYMSGTQAYIVVTFGQSASNAIYYSGGGGGSWGGGWSGGGAVCGLYLNAYYYNATQGGAWQGTLAGSIPGGGAAAPLGSGMVDLGVRL